MSMKCLESSQSVEEGKIRSRGFLGLLKYLGSLVAGTWSETKKMYHAGFFLKLADDDV